MSLHGHTLTHERVTPLSNIHARHQRRSCHLDRTRGTIRGTDEVDRVSSAPGVGVWVGEVHYSVSHFGGLGTALT